MRKYGHHHQQLSPDRAKVWKERSPRYQQRQPEPEPEQEQELELHQKSRKVPVVYYLCRNRQLEHPHFIEVPLTSSEGLFLRGIHNTYHLTIKSTILCFNEIVNPRIS